MGRNKLIHYFLLAFLLLFGTYAFAQDYFDSNIIEIQTPPPSPFLGMPDVYFYASDVKTSSVRLNLVFYSIEKATSTIKGDIGGNLPVELATTNSTSTFQTLVQNLNPLTNYTFEALVEYKGSNGSIGSKRLDINVTTLGVDNLDTPTNLNVFTMGTSSLILNWKDTSTSTARYFQIQRLKISPNNVKLSTTSVPNNQNQVKLIVSTSTSPYKGFLVYSSLPDFANATTVREIYFIDPNSKIEINVEKNYYYKIKDLCSLIKVDWKRTANALGPDDVCIDEEDLPSIYISADSSIPKFALLKNNFLQIVNNLFLKTYNKLVSLINRDSYKVEVKAQSSDLFSDFVQKYGVFITTTHPYYIDSGLDENTVYAYRVRACYSDNRCSLWSNEVERGRVAAARTLKSISTDQTYTNAQFCIQRNVCKLFTLPIPSQSNLNIWGTGNQCYKNADCENVGRVEERVKER
jgi:hypothetical protein